MVIVTVVCSVFVNKVGFESDMMKMNYISRELSKTEENLNKINNYKLNSVYVVAHGENLQEALLNNEKLMEKGNDFLQQKKIRQFQFSGILIVFRFPSAAKNQRWNNCWTEDRKKKFLENFDEAAIRTGFKTGSFGEFFSLMHKEVYSY